MSIIRTVGFTIFWGILVWLVFSGLLWLVLWPAVPHTGTGWLLFLGLAVPAFMLVSLIRLRTRLVRARTGRN